MQVKRQRYRYFFCLGGIYAEPNAESSVYQLKIWSGSSRRSTSKCSFSGRVAERDVASRRHPSAVFGNVPREAAEPLRVGQMSLYSLVVSDYKFGAAKNLLA
jgi:hypothetical protein